MAVMYSKLGGCLGVTTKLGPLARTDLWAVVKGLLEMLMTHLGLGSSLEEPWGGQLGGGSEVVFLGDGAILLGSLGCPMPGGMPMALPDWPGWIAKLTCLGRAINFPMGRLSSRLGNAASFAGEKESSGPGRIATFPGRKVSNSLGRTASFTRGKVSSCQGRITYFTEEKVSNGTGRTASFTQGKVSSCLGRIASFPGGRWAIARGELRRMPDWLPAGVELLPSWGGRWVIAWEELLTSPEGRWAAAGRELLPSLGGRWAIAGGELGEMPDTWLLAGVALLPSWGGRWVIAWEGLLTSLEGRRAPVWLLV